MSEQFEQRDDGITDEALIGLVGTAFDEGRRGYEASDVLARGRQLRRRKRAVPTLGALGVLAASASLALALTGPNTAASTPSANGDHTYIANGSTVNVDTASFSVHTDTKTGTVTVTIYRSSLTRTSSGRSWPKPASARTSTHSATARESRRWTLRRSPASSPRRARAAAWSSSTRPRCRAGLCSN